MGREEDSLPVVTRRSKTSLLNSLVVDINRFHITKRLPHWKPVPRSQIVAAMTRK